MADDDDDDPATFHSLPDELLFDIFSRFPAKSLSLLRCVCSRWTSILTTNPDFLSLYHNRRQTSPLLLLSRRSTPSDLSLTCHCTGTGTSRFRFASDGADQLISVLSCRGVVCLVSESEVFICDPVTGRGSNLAVSGNLKASSSVVSLGYSNGGFKLIHFYVVERFDEYHYEAVKEAVCEVMSVPERLLGFEFESEWRCLGRRRIEVLGRKSCVCVGGCVYWMVAEKAYDPVNIRILRFELEGEGFGVVSFSRKYSDRSVECLGMLEMKGRLCLTDKLPWEMSTAVWELEDGRDNVWSKKYVIDLGGIGCNDLMILGHVCRSVGGGEGELVIKVGVDRAMVYDLEKGTFREVEIQAEIEGEEEPKVLELLLDRKNML